MGKLPEDREKSIVELFIAVCHMGIYADLKLLKNV